MISLNVNGKPVQVDVDGDTPLLWVLRDHLDLRRAPASRFSEPSQAVCG